ncbi:DUF2971 domain-containing protein [Streptococcus gordonii]|uniref:DUF2971 domain-containing protein n=1 Tax=Streptococcus gordonii TaxID=1302 RepID=UPI0022834632|nr:DUF2971 domain-containing protein [Streptococcus gordonii]MCY7134133.1 DUF2971 domain-containing protein [Streptococcus gordonii]
MENRIIITKSPYNGFSNQSYKDAFVFYQSDWNDYGYYISYVVYYYNKKSQARYIGGYRVYTHNIEEQDTHSYTQIKHINEQIWQDHGLDANWPDVHLTIGFNDDYFSLAQHLNFYQNVYDIFQNELDYSDFLNKLRDLTITELSDSIKDNEGVKRALLRNDGITKSAEIIELNRQLKEIDEKLNIGNCVSVIVEKLKDDQLNEEKKSYISKIIKECNYDLLDQLVGFYIENYDENQNYTGYEYLKSLVDKTDFEQLKSELETIENDELKEISASVKEIKEKLRYSSNDDSFIHYTSLNTLKFLLYKTDDKNNYPKLRLSNARQMNDPNEGYILFNLIGIEKEELPETDYDTSPFFFASMTQIEKDQKLDDSLPMWKQYGDDAKGINLTYHSDYIKSLMDDGIEIYKVCYNVEADSLKEEIDAIKSAFDKIKQYDNDDKRTKYFSSALNLIDDIRYLFKETDYSYENEYRIIKSYEGKESEIFTSDSSNSVIPGLYVYIDKELKYSKIKLGPKCDDIDFVAPYIKHIDRKIEVTRSEISYR